ncbi:hypothetical protein HanRHA438_Chr09g0385561 [Helianthus annuus]|nr:hypothetical protein HanRHA438_Chr09g0385561 [Helianthus annuus]
MDPTRLELVSVQAYLFEIDPGSKVRVRLQPRHNLRTLSNELKTGSGSLVVI